MAALSTEMRRRFATFIDKRDLEPPVSEDKGKPRFPIPDEKRARNALSRLDQSKGLSKEQKRIIAQRAANVLGEITAEAEEKGVTRLTKPPRQAIVQKPITLRPKGRKRAFAK